MREARRHNLRHTYATKHATVSFTAETRDARDIYNNIPRIPPFPVPTRQVPTAKGQGLEGYARTPLVYPASKDMLGHTGSAGRMQAPGGRTETPLATPPSAATCTPGSPRPTVQQVRGSRV